MVRDIECSQRDTGGFPHVRGDGPSVKIGDGSVEEFSPRAWGWSVVRRRVGLLHPVFPTCVGMVRRSSGSCNKWRRFPHVRGDGPPSRNTRRGRGAFSPRAWGWSVGVRIVEQGLVVFPTCVGMVRKPRLASMTSVCFPHVRGDGPFGWWDPIKTMWFSPRAWGWSGYQTCAQGLRGVFPTCVGMVRAAANIPSALLGFPHGRGDGPKNGPAGLMILGFSPRAWGWSD